MRQRIRLRGGFYESSCCDLMDLAYGYTVWTRCREAWSYTVFEISRGGPGNAGLSTGDVAYLDRVDEGELCAIPRLRQLAHVERETAIAHPGWVSAVSRLVLLH